MEWPSIVSFNTWFASPQILSWEAPKYWTLKSARRSALVNLPKHISTPAKEFDVDLNSNIDGLRMDDMFYRVYGGEENEGAVIVSQVDEPVDFSDQFCGRVVNLVPIDEVNTAL